MEPLLDKPNRMITLNVQNFLMESIHQNYKYKDISVPTLMHEHNNRKNVKLPNLKRQNLPLILLDKCPILFQRCTENTLMIDNQRSWKL